MMRNEARSCNGKKYDAFRPKSLLKRLYYTTVMRIFEGIGKGDQLLVVLKKA